MSTPTEAIAELRSNLPRWPGFLAGSAVAADDFGFAEYNDIDVFVPSQQILVATVQHLLDRGYVVDERFDRVWYRWLRYGLKGWHTNSMKMESLAGVETNVIYKLVDGHPTTSLSQVLESFDFGLLGVGWDLESGRRMDFRPVLFPGLDVHGELGLMPNKLDNWRQGFISQYNGLREGMRIGKYGQRGFPVQYAGQQLSQGYRVAASYHSNRWEDDKKLLGEIYYAIADKIDAGDWDDLVSSYTQLDFNDPLDQILDALV